MPFLIEKNKLGLVFLHTMMWSLKRKQKRNSEISGEKSLSKIVGFPRGNPEKSYGHPQKKEHDEFCVGVCESSKTRLFMWVFPKVGASKNGW